MESICKICYGPAPTGARYCPRHGEQALNRFALRTGVDIPAGAPDRPRRHVGAVVDGEFVPAVVRGKA